MLQSHPGAAQVPETTPPPVLPASVRNAVKVMYAGAVVTAIHVIADAVTAGAEKAAVEAKYPHLSAGGVNTITHIIVIAQLAAAVIGTVVWVWIARSCRGGKNWARVTGTVLFAVAALGVVRNLFGPEVGVNLAFVFAECLIGLAAVVLLWRPDSNAYFSYFKRPQF